MAPLSGKIEEMLTHALGEAVVRVWSYLPPGIQHELFEEVITEYGESMRQPLAVFLHGHHVRTSEFHSRQMLEPDSLGG